MQSQSSVSSPVVTGLLESLKWFARRETNAVIELLKTAGEVPDRLTLVEEQHYPDPPLRLLHTGLITFYHYHEKPFCFGDEHGHFHLFVNRPGSKEAAHLVALSINPQGQPIRWFTVNQWVTGDSWRSAPELVQEIMPLSIAGDDTAVPGDEAERRVMIAHWLLSLVLLYRKDIGELLVQRDQKLRDAADQDADDTDMDRIIDTIGKNRDLYILSERGIDLGARLEEALLEPDQSI